MQKAGLLFAAVLMIFALFLAPPAVAASNDNNVNYTIRKGDNLITLADRYMLKRQHYRVVQRNNRIADPLRIPVGKVITIPRSLLKFKPAKARLISVRGNVMLSAANLPRAQATTGQVLGEGAALSTAASSFVTLALDDGSRVSIPSNSDMRISRLRTYVLGDNLDYDFDVTKGAARSKVAPLKSTNDSYRVHTPKAVSAVRGTDFEMRYDEATGSDFAEVDEGALAVATQGRDVKLPAGNGLAVSATGKVIQEALLPPPVLHEPGKVHADEDVSFAVKENSEGYAHRFQISADAGFVEQVADAKVEDGTVTFKELPNGNYFVRARAISSNGIHGLPATYAFKRRLNGIKASAEQGDDGYTFKWFGSGEGIQRYHFQLFQETPTGNLMIDEAALSSPQIGISDLPAGDYYWRVGSVQYLDGEVTTNWTPAEKLTAG